MHSLSVTIQFRRLVSLTWMAHINTSSYIDGTGTTTTLPFSLWLNPHYSGIVCGEKWHEKNCSCQEMSRQNSGKKEKFHKHNPIHVLQTVLLSLLLAHSQAQTKSESIYPFPRNGIMPTSLQWRENNCVWNVSRTMECRPVLMSRSVRGVPKIIMFCPVQWKLLSCCGGVFVPQSKPLQGPRIKT